MSRTFRYRHMPRPHGVRQDVNYTESRLNTVERRLEHEFDKTFDGCFNVMYDARRRALRMVMSVQNVWQLNYIGYGASFTDGAKKISRTFGNRRWRRKDRQILNYLRHNHDDNSIEFMRKHTAWDNWDLT